MSRYKAYPEYKDSGVEWLGVIPIDWHSTKVKFGYQITLGKMLQKDQKEYTQVLRPYLKAVNIQNSGVQIDDVESMWFSPSEIQSLRLKQGDVLISEGGDVGRAAIWKDELPECYIQNAINRARPKGQRDGKFLYYWMSMLKLSDYINILCNKATIAHYTVDKLESSPIFLPPYSDAQKIANFLDHETAKIDTLIAKQQELIKLLKEKRQAVISHAVTKGLNPNAPMRDSGVEWLGDVPAHWEITRAKFVSEIFIPQRNKPELNELTGVAWATMEDMKKPYISQTKNFVSDEAAKFSGSKILVAGSVIASCVGNFGIASINSIDVVINQQLQAFIPRKIKAEFLREIISISKSYFELIGTAATLVYVNQQGFENLPVVVPPISEQEKICSLILEKSLKFDDLISQCETAIGLIQERRTALISSAVTGKIDVRDVEISAKECCS